MQMRLWFCCGMAAVAMTTAGAGGLSDPEFINLRTDVNSFWQTAPGNVFTVPIPYPAGASKASLSVTGLDYSSVTDDITAKEVTVSLPAVTGPQDENVYTLTLTFDDGTALTNRIGVVIGAAQANEGETRCIAPQTSRAWPKVKGRAVLPIPYGTTSFTVNGVETDPGLGGAQGWYAIGGLTYGHDASLGLVVGGIPYAASLIGGPAGLTVIFK